MAHDPARLDEPGTIALRPVHGESAVRSDPSDEAPPSPSYWIPQAPPVDAVYHPSRSSLETSRKPGLLVLPFERCTAADDGWEPDALSERLILRFAARLPSLRVVSWTTAKLQRASRRPLDLLSGVFDVRYRVDGRCDVTNEGLVIDVRIVDAGVDRVVLTNRFASGRLGRTAFSALASEAIVDQLALVLADAPVERFASGDVDPECCGHYLDGVREFDARDKERSGSALLAMERALQIDATFAPARAMRALIRLQDTAIGGGDVGDEARAVAAACRADGTAPTTLALLDAAIARQADRAVDGRAGAARHDG